jgi:molybdopterin-guanine dinucleotide biosynthesis protein A
MKIGVVLLAGGESRRMGRDKALLPYRGRPLWQQQVELLRKLEPLELFISARRDPAWRPSDAIFAADVPPSRGPLSGLCAALGLTKGSHLLALAVDMPFMNEAGLRSLCDQIEPDRGVLPMISHRAEPLAAIYPAQARPHLSAALAGTDFSLQTLTRRLVEAGLLRVVVVCKRDEMFFGNVNEPRDVKSERSARGT